MYKNTMIPIDAATIKEKDEAVVAAASCCTELKEVCNAYTGITKMDVRTAKHKTASLAHAGHKQSAIGHCFCRALLLWHYLCAKGHNRYGDSAIGVRG